MAVEFRFDPGFVEEAVFLQMARPADAAARQMATEFHHAREAAYAPSDAAQREHAFQQLARRYFQALGLESCVTERFDELPLLSARVELAVIRRVWSRKDEQVELYAGGAPEAPAGWEVSRTVFLGLQPARVLERERFIAYLRHELMHVADMLDPTFAYDPHVAIGGECEPENELIRGRFRVLWDLWVHERMKRLGWQTVTADFEFLDPARREELFRVMSKQDCWTQEELLALARQPHVAVPPPVGLRRSPVQTCRRRSVPLQAGRPSASPQVVG